MVRLFAAALAIPVIAGSAVVAVSSHQERTMATSEPAGHHVDHVIVGIDDIKRGLEQFERLTGVSPDVGGVHPGAGTQNALVSLGERTYLEIMAPAENASPSVRERFGRFSTLTPTGWAVSTTSAAASEQLLRASGYVVRGPSAGSRVRPDGEVLRWTTLSVDVPRATKVPFLIEWNAESRHPASTSPAGCRLQDLSIWERAPSALNSFVRQLGLAVSIREGEPAIRIELRCPKGSVEWRS